MYNRYVPQSDGSYQRNWVPEKPPHKPQQNHPTGHTPPPEPPKQTKMPMPKHRPEPVGSFFQQLLPQNFDTGDLIVVLLLLLLAGDCEEDRSTALLTLALYILM